MQLINNANHFEHTTLETSHVKDDQINVKGVIKQKQFSDLSFENNTRVDKGIHTTKEKNINELANFKKLEKEDLKVEDLLVIYIYYDRNNFNCANCRYFRTFLEHFKVNLRFINFGSDVFLASKFNSYVFPSFIIRYKGKSYKMQNIKTGEELLDVVNSLQENTSENIRNIVEKGYAVPFKTYMEVGTFTNSLICNINVFIFKTVDFFYFLMRFMPEWVFHLIIFLIIIYLIYSILRSILDIQNIKKKNE